MKTIKVNLYEFRELGEEIQEKVLEKYWEINVDYDWWDGIYEDANQVDFKITEFDIDRERYVNGEFKGSAYNTIEKILENHGESCETYKLALEYKEKYNQLEKYEDGEIIENESFEEWENEFLLALCEEFRSILSKQFEYSVSRESIIETIELNEYTFEADGTMNNG
jgi:hypothetical protein